MMIAQVFPRDGAIPILLAQAINDSGIVEAIN
jgi:hypothetical protein